MNHTILNLKSKNYFRDFLKKHSFDHGKIEIICNNTKDEYIAKQASLIVNHFLTKDLENEPNE